MDAGEVGSSGNCGSFVVSKLDANGTGPGTRDKFPDHAEVLPKRGGFVHCPVIRMDSGGDGMISGCSLFGVICDFQNTWNFTAVARDPAEPSINIPQGYWVEWDVGAPYTSGGPNNENIQVVYHSPGRYTPKLFVKTIDPETGQEVIAGKAEIHSILVKLRRTCVNVDPIPQIPVDQIYGAPFHVDNDTGSAQLGVTFRAEIHKTPGAPEHPRAPDFRLRGRVSPDGYPQNEYWVVSEEDNVDLPQVASAASNSPITFYIQGYSAPSINKDDLQLVLSGLPQREVCHSGFYHLFADCSPSCGAIPPGKPPVDVSAWEVTDIEPFNSVFPIVFGLDGLEAKYHEEIPDPIEVPADNVASDYPEDPDSSYKGEEEGYNTYGFRSRVNFTAYVDWEARSIHPDYFKPVPDENEFRIVWHFTSLGNLAGGPNYCLLPGLKDVEDPIANRIDQLTTGGRMTALLRALTSTVQFNFSFPVESVEGALPRARAGDQFCIVPHGEMAHPSLGSRFWDRHTVEIVPGDKAIHLTVPQPADRPAWFDPDTFDPKILFFLTDAEISASFGGFNWTTPLGSHESDRLAVFLFDRYRNPLPEGRPVTFSIEGGGRLYNSQPLPDTPETLDSPENPPQASGEIIGCTDDRGRAVLPLAANADPCAGGVWFRQHRYPSCPWQADHTPDPSRISLNVDGEDAVVNESKLTPDDPPPPSPPKPVIAMDFAGTVDGALDRAQGGSYEVRALFTRGPAGLPITGVPIAFACTNGALSAEEVPTDANGIASVNLLPAGARLDSEDRNGVEASWRNEGSIIITASVGGVRGQVSTHQPPTGHPTTTPSQKPYWVDSSILSLSVEHDILVTDTNGPGDFYEVETLVQGGHAMLLVPIFRETRVVIHGEPNHEYKVEVSQPPGVPNPADGDPNDPAVLAGVRATYSFDNLIGPWTLGDPEGFVQPGYTNAGPPSPDSVSGFSLPFNGAQYVKFVDQPAAHPGGGLQISFWIKPTQFSGAVLLERGPVNPAEGPDDYHIELLSDGRLRLIAGMNGAAATSDGPVPLNQWTYVEARIHESFAKLAHGPDPGSLDATFARASAPGSFSGLDWSVSVGLDFDETRGFHGLINEVRFLKGGFEPEETDLLAVDPGAPPGTGQAIGLLSGNRIVTDAFGRAEFIFRIVPKPFQELEDHRPVPYDITVYGSDEKKVRVHGAPTSLWGHLMAVGRAFLLGDESLIPDQASWYEKAAAWASSVIPFVSDLRQLGYEIYKGASGCDDVSWSNVIFSTVGLVADIATFGTAGTALRAVRGGVLPAMKLVMKEIAQNSATDLAFRGAVAGFVELTTVEIMTAEGDMREPRPWVVNAAQFFADIHTWTQGQYQEMVRQLFRSPDDLMVAASLYSEVFPGNSQMIANATETLEEIFSTTAEIAQVLGPAPGGGQVNAGLRGPILIGGGLPGTFGGIEQAMSDLEVGARMSAREMRSLQVKTTRLLSQLLKTHPQVSLSFKARRGLIAWKQLVVRGHRWGEAEGRPATRVARALEHLNPTGNSNPAGVNQFLEDFAEMYQWAKGNEGALRKLQGLSTHLAPRSDLSWARKRQMKGAVLSLRSASEARAAGKLDLAEDTLEPWGSSLARPSVRRQWWDRKQRIGPGNPRFEYVECKNWADLASPSRAKMIGVQMGNNYLRDPVLTGMDTVDQINDLPGSLVVFPAGQVLPDIDLIRGEAVKIIKAKKGWDADRIWQWAKENIRLGDPVIMPYHVAD